MLAVIAARTFRKLMRTLRRLARTNAVRVPGLFCLFTGLLIAAVVYTREPAMPTAPFIMLGLGSGAGTGVGSGAGVRGAGLGVNDLLANGLGADDPVVQFGTTRVGHLLFASPVSDNCRRVLFNNSDGELYEAGRVSCGQPADRPVEVSGLDRIEAMRKSFQKQ
jgi:hypothetical protein